MTSACSVRKSLATKFLVIFTSHTVSLLLDIFLVVFKLLLLIVYFHGISRIISFLRCSTLILLKIIKGWFIVFSIFSILFIIYFQVLFFLLVFFHRLLDEDLVEGASGHGYRGVLLFRIRIESIPPK